MATTRPTAYPAWATIYDGDQLDAAGNSVESRSVPPVELQNDGLLPDEPMARQWLNYQFWNINQWINYMDENGGSSMADFQGDATVEEVNAFDVTTLVANYAWHMLDDGDITVGDETVPVEADDVIMWYENDLDGGSGFSNLGAIKGVKGDKGDQGEVGDAPEHQWDDTALAFQNPDLTWGDFVDLKGEKGDIGTGVTLVGSGTVDEILAITDAEDGDLWVTIDSGYFPSDHPVTPDQRIDAGNGLAWSELGYWSYVNFGVTTYGIVVAGAGEVLTILANTTAVAGDLWITIDDGELPVTHPVQPNQPISAGDGLVYTEAGYWAWVDMGLDFSDREINLPSDVIIPQTNYLFARKTLDESLVGLISYHKDDFVQVGYYDSGTLEATEEVVIMAKDFNAYISDSYIPATTDSRISREILGGVKYQILTTKNGVTLATDQTINGNKTFANPVTIPDAVDTTDAINKGQVDAIEASLQANIDALEEATTQQDADTLASAKAYTEEYAYDKATVDAALDLKANSSDVYLKTETYTQAETNALLDVKADNADVAAVQDQVDVNTSDIAALQEGSDSSNSAIADNAAAIAANAEAIAINTANISSNDTDIAANATAIADNAAAIAVNVEDITTNAANIASNDTDIAANATAIATNAEAIAANTAAIESNDADIATNVTDIAANATAITENATNIATNATAIADNAAEIATKADDDRVIHNVASGSSIDVPIVGTEARPEYPDNAMISFNTDLKEFEGFNPETGEWGALGSGGGTSAPEYVAEDITVDPNKTYAVDVSEGTDITLTIDTSLFLEGNYVTVMPFNRVSGTNPIIYLTATAGEWSDVDTDVDTLSIETITNAAYTIQYLSGLLKVVDGIGESTAVSQEDFDLLTAQVEANAETIETIQGGEVYSKDEVDALLATKVDNDTFEELQSRVNILEVNNPEVEVVTVTEDFNIQPNGAYLVDMSADVGLTGTITPSDFSNGDVFQVTVINSVADSKEVVNLSAEAGVWASRDEDVSTLEILGSTNASYTMRYFDGLFVIVGGVGESSEAIPDDEDTTTRRLRSLESMVLKLHSELTKLKKDM